GNTTIHLGGNLEINNLGGDGLGNYGGAGVCQIIFENQTTPQTFINESTINTDIDFVVASGSTLIVEDGHIIGPSGSFTLNGTLILGSLDPTGSIQGNIPTPMRTFSSGSHIIYNGTGAQFMGSAHPSTSGVSVTIDNSN